MREVRLEFDQVSKRNNELEEQVEKYKTAVEAQKKYITGLTNAMELSDQAREKMKEEIKGIFFLVRHRLLRPYPSLCSFDILNLALKRCRLIAINFKSS